MNGESERARRHARPGHILYSRDGVDGWNVTEKETDLGGTSFVLNGDGRSLKFRSKLLGLHQVGPLAAAVHLALGLGLSPDQIERGIGSTKPFDHRLQPKSDQAGVITLDDSYNGNPDGVQAMIEFLASLKHRRRFYVTPGLVEMGEKTAEIHAEIGRSLARAHIEKVILIKNSVTPYIEQGLREEKYEGELLWFDDALEAFAALPYLTVKDDVVLLQNDWPDQYQ